MTTSRSLVRRLGPLAVAAGLVVALAACASSTSAVPSPSVSTGSPRGTGPSSVPAAPPSAPESNPPGDIPDNQAYVVYRPAAGDWEVKVPEGWGQSTATDGAVTFSDKLNSIQLTWTANAPRPSDAAVKASVLTAEGGRPGFAFGQVSTVQRSAGPALRATYRVDSEPDPVTGKTVNDDVESYVFWRNGERVQLRLAGPRGADNVDPWKIITDSFRWTA